MAKYVYIVCLIGQGNPTDRKSLKEIDEVGIVELFYFFHKAKELCGSSMNRDLCHKGFLLNQG